MKLTRNENGTYTFERENGTIDLTANEVSFLVNRSNLLGLRDSIEYWCREMDGDEIDLSKAPNGFDDFVEEIYVDLEDEVEYGNYQDDNDIQEKIRDTADYYDMTID